MKLNLEFETKLNKLYRQKKIKYRIEFLDLKYNQLLQYCLSNDLHNAKKLFSKYKYDYFNTYFIFKHNSKLFLDVCKIGNARIAKWIYEKANGNFIKSVLEAGILYSCCYGNINITKLIYQFYEKINSFDINEFITCYTIAFLNRKINIVKWFLKKIPNVSSQKRYHNGFNIRISEVLTVSKRQTQKEKKALQYLQCVSPQDYNIQKKINYTKKQKLAKMI
jgi:hypothetical protein